MNALKSTSDKAADSSRLTSSAGVGLATDSYRSLTLKEEEDIKQFLDELSNDAKLRNAAELTGILEQQLAHFEGVRSFENEYF